MPEVELFELLPEFLLPELFELLSDLLLTELFELLSEFLLSELLVLELLFFSSEPELPLSDDKEEAELLVFEDKPDFDSLFEELLSAVSEAVLLC